MKHGSVRTWCAYIATLAGIGRLPLASGTWATYCTLPFVYLISLLSLSLPVRLVVIAAILISSFVIITLALPLFKDESDPSAIVLDECVGTLVTFVAVPFSLKMLAIGFCLFRFFDIVKPLGIKRVEQIGGAAGILADDVVAGLYAAALMYLLHMVL